ncbi:MAG TPA: HTTM domain-containing protein [Terriglobales bacterium]|nr:HTTM domain-containing protein [Terriglobales bacterium]
MLSRQSAERGGLLQVSSDPLNLAVLRLAVFASLVWLGWRADVAGIATLPADLRVAPAGYGWCLASIPFDYATLNTARWLLIAASLAAMLGWRTRIAASLACLSAIYVLGVPHFFGKVNHHNHHFVWFAALLAVAPSADALSLDAWRRGPHRQLNTGDYRLALWIVWLSIGCIYFFPGLAKLEHGTAWMTSDNIRHLLHEFWSRKQFLPALRLDHSPLLCATAGVLTVSFEAAFLPALFVPRLRPVLVAAGLGFHAANAYFLRIFFVGLALCYVSFIDWARLLARLGLRPQSLAPSAPRHSAPVLAVGALLLTANVAAGVFGIDSWPFSVYPRFATLWPPVRTEIEAEVLANDGSTRPVRIPLHPQAARALLALPSGAERERRLEALQTSLLQQTARLQPGERLRLWRVRRSTAPELWQAPPLSRELFGEVGG